MEFKKNTMPPEESQAGTTADTPAPDGGQTPVEAPSSAEGELKAAIEKLTEEKKEVTDLLLRKQAELENFRKRTQREKEDWIQHATADLIRALLPTLDAMDRALAHRGGGDAEDFFQGLELIRKELMDVLARAGLAPLEVMGKTFDPHLHQAAEMVEAGEHGDQEIVGELQRGYLLKKRLLRPAAVRVAVAKPQPEAGDHPERE